MPLVPGGSGVTTASRHAKCATVGKAEEDPAFCVMSLHCAILLCCSNCRVGNIGNAEMRIAKYDIAIEILIALDAVLGLKSWQMEVKGEKTSFEPRVALAETRRGMEERVSCGWEEGNEKKSQYAIHADTRHGREGEGP